jgi:hypothetical protein
MKIFTRVLFMVVLVAITTLVNAQSVQTIGSRDANLYGRSGLTSDVDKTNLNSPVNIYSYNNAIYVVTSETNLSNAKFAVFSLNGKMVTVNNINGNLTKYEMESGKGLFVVKAVVNGKVYSKKVYIY